MSTRVPQPVGPVSGTEVPRYAGPSTFLRIPDIQAVPDYDIAVLGAPFDSGNSFRPGARFGPMHVRMASRNLRPAFHVDLDVKPFERVQVVDAGDVPCTPFSIEGAVSQIETQAREILGDGQGRRIIAIGGDHTVMLPVMRAVAAEQGPVAVIHFDAHLDTWDNYFGQKITHGTILRRAYEEGLLAKDKSIHIGIRGPIYDRMDLTHDENCGFQLLRAGDLDTMGVDATIDAIRRRVGDTPVYLSVDIDVLDPAFAPGTGTPEAGGFTSRELLTLMRRLNGLNIVGADIVEVAPVYDHAEITSVAAATLGYDLIALMANDIAS